VSSHPPDIDIMLGKFFSIELSANLIAKLRNIQFWKNPEKK
jgi:hypothetical protein